MLNDLVNGIFANNQSMNQIIEAEQAEFNNLESKSISVFNNNFILTADIEGIRKYESLFNIIADENKESLDFRRARLINRLASLPPFTKIFLEQKLETIFGAGNWKLNIIPEDYLVYIDVETNIANLFEQTMEDIKQIIPANLILISSALREYTHRYLNLNFTHAELAQFTQGHLSQYS